MCPVGTAHAFVLCGYTIHSTVFFVFTSRKLGAAKAEMAESEETPVVICSDFSNAQMHNHYILHILQSKSNT